MEKEILDSEALLNILEDLEEEKNKLNERLKELNLLYSFDKLQGEDYSISEFILKLVAIIPKAWQYPKITCVRIKFNSKIYRTKNFKKTKWMQSSVIKTKNKTGGLVEVGYLVQKPDEQEGPFLKEERALIDSLATQLGEFVVRRKGQEQIKKLSSAVEQSTEGIAIVDLKGNVTYLNNAWVKMHGYKDPKSLMGKNLSIFHSKEQLKNEAIPFNKKVEKYGTYSGEVGHITRDGKLFPTLMTTTLLKDKQGKPYALVGIARDITERKRAELKIKKLNQELKQRAETSETKYKSLYDSSSDAIMVLEPPTWKFTAGNPETIKMFGLKDEEELISIGPWDVSPEKQPNRVASNIMAKKMIVKAMKEGTNLFEWQHKRIRGGDFPARVLLTRMNLNEKEVLQATVRDITKEKDAEIILRQKTKDLEESNKLKDLFMDIMRHDLLNPAGVVKMSSQLALLEEKDVKKKETLEKIIRNNSRVIRMIENASILAKLESGEKIEFKEEDLGIMLEGAVEELGDSAKEKGMKIRVASKGKFVAVVNPLIQNVFSNFISNAIKYSPEKTEIVVGIKAKGDDWLIYVEDRGEGIPDKFKKSIFDRFTRLEKGAIKGSGLGLAISKKIAEAHGGKVWVADHKGGGSVFYVLVPKVHGEVAKRVVVPARVKKAVAKPAVSKKVLVPKKVVKKVVAAKVVEKKEVKEKRDGI